MDKNLFFSNFLNTTYTNVTNETIQYMQIILDGFDREFKLNLKSQENADFLSPNLVYFNKVNKYFYSNSSSLNDPHSLLNNTNCFFTGFIDNDTSSFANINLCHEGHVVSGL